MDADKAAVKDKAVRTPMPSVSTVGNGDTSKRIASSSRRIRKQERSRCLGMADNDGSG